MVRQTAADILKQNAQRTTDKGAAIGLHIGEGAKPVWLEFVNPNLH